MKSILRITIALLFAAVIFPFAAVAQKKSDYTIDQYFNMLTESQLPILGKYKTARQLSKRLIIKTDTFCSPTKNGKAGAKWSFSITKTVRI